MSAQESPNPTSETTGRTLEHPGRFFRECRVDRQISLRALARTIGVSAAYLSDVERGRRGMAGLILAYAGKHFGGGLAWWVSQVVAYDTAIFAEQRERELFALLKRRKAS